MISEVTRSDQINTQQKGHRLNLVDLETHVHLEEISTMNKLCMLISRLVQ